MTIYELTYLSTSIPVKAYLGVPSWIATDDTAILGILMERYGTHPRLEVHCVVENVADNAADNESHPQASCHASGFVYCRGGIGRVGMAKLDWIQQFVHCNRVVMAPWYRGTFGAPGRDEFGGADCEDVNEACRLMQSLPFVDPSRVDVMGFSRGAVNATKSAITVSGIHRLVLWGGVSSLVWTYEERVDLRRMLKRVVGGSPTKVPDAYEQRSPIAMASRIPCPTLIMHGTEDAQVPIRHGEAMYQALTARHRQVDFHRYTGYGHHMPLTEHLNAIHRMMRWLSEDEHV